MQLWLAFGAQPDPRIQPPAACPHPGCGGRRFRLHQVVVKGVRDAAPTRAGAPAAASRVVDVHRYTCRRCRRTFRAYPASVGRGSVSTPVQRLAAALRLLGLSFRDVSRALAVLGVALGKSQAQALIAPRLRGLDRRGIAPLFDRVEIAGPPAGDRAARVADQPSGDRGARVTGRGGAAPCAPAPAASVWIHGRRLALRRAVDPRGRVALVVDDVDRETRRAVDAWVRDTLRGFGIEVEVVFPTRRAPRRAAEVPGRPPRAGRGRPARSGGRSSGRKPEGRSRAERSGDAARPIPFPAGADGGVPGGVAPPPVSDGVSAAVAGPGGWGRPLVPAAENGADHRDRSPSASRFASGTTASLASPAPSTRDGPCHRDGATVMARSHRARARAAVMARPQGGSPPMGGRRPCPPRRIA